MPRVNKEYLIEKKNCILDCAMEIMQEKPLYQITMRDIIKKMGVSQGAIYRYYSGLEEIFMELMNRETAKITILEEMNHIVEKDCNEAEKLKLMFIELGRYIIEVEESIGGKFYFEFLVHFAFDKKNQLEVLSNLNYKQNLMAAQGIMIQYIYQMVQEGKFQPIYPMDSIVSYVSVTIDGISNDYALMIGAKQVQSSAVMDPKIMFQMLGECVLKHLGK